jgi:hypothetical protein
MRDVWKIKCYWVPLVALLVSCTPTAGPPAPATSDYIAVFSHKHTVLGTVYPWEILEFENPRFCVASQIVSSGVIHLSAETNEDGVYITLFAWHYSQDGSWSVFPIDELWLDDGTQYKSTDIVEHQTFFAHPIQGGDHLLEHLSSLRSDEGGLLINSNRESMRLSFGSLKKLISTMAYACSRERQPYRLYVASDN